MRDRRVREIYLIKGLQDSGKDKNKKLTRQLNLLKRDFQAQIDTNLLKGSQRTLKDPTYKGPGTSFTSI